MDFEEWALTPLSGAGASAQWRVDPSIVGPVGAGIGVHAARFVHMPRSHPEALSDAWGNLYEEFAIAIEARRLGRILPAGLLDIRRWWMVRLA